MEELKKRLWERRVRIELPYWPYVKYITYAEAIAILRNELLEEAIKQMRETGKPYAIVKCPCCGRRIKITIEEVSKKH